MSLHAINGRALGSGARIANRDWSGPVQHSTAPALRQSNPSLAVIVTCHAAYLPFLAEALASIDAQSPPPAEKVLVLDDCDFDPPSGWNLIRGCWHNPNPARNEGWRSTSSPWCVFWDGDDSMPHGYVAGLSAAILSAAPSTGIVYPTLTRSDYDSGQRVWNANTPDWSYWGQREQLFIQSGAAWKRSALFQVGGWDDQAGVHDDGNLATRITALGFTAHRLAEPVVDLRAHSLGHRWQVSDAQRAEDLWRFRTCAIILPVCASRFLPYLAGKLTTLDIPKRTSVVIVDNTPNGEAGRMLSAWNLGRFEGMQIIRVPAQNADTDRNGWERHQQVSRMHNTGIQATNADMIFTWEQDVRIEDDVLRVLWGHFLSGSKVGGAAGVYETANDPGWVCGSKSIERWRTDTRMEDAPTGAEDWGFVHLGCTLWAGHALRRCLPYDPQWSDRWVAGGDAVMCQRVRRLGLRVVMDGRVRCVHDWRLP